METSLWERFPIDMQNHILSKLPLRALVRLRCVSKPWKSIMANPGTLNLSRPLKSPLMAEPMLAVGYDGKESLEWTTYSFESNRWTIMPSFPELVQNAVSSGEKVDYYSAGGLLFFLLSSYSNYGVTKCLVYNPLTKASRELPLFARDWLCGAFAIPIADTETNSYKFLMGDQEHWARYTSSTDSWDEGSITSVGCLASGTNGVQCNDLLFFVVPTMRGHSDLATYNSEKNVWLDTFDYEQMAEVGYHLNNRGYSENNRIFEWDGSLFLMTAQDGCISELDLNTKTWTKSGFKFCASTRISSFADSGAPIPTFLGHFLTIGNTLESCCKLASMFFFQMQLFTNIVVMQFSCFHAILWNLCYLV